MMLLKLLLAGLLALGFGGGVISCSEKKEGAMEKLGKEIDKGVEKMGEKIEEAGDKVKEATEK